MEKLGLFGTFYFCRLYLLRYFFYRSNSSWICTVGYSGDCILDLKVPGLNHPWENDIKTVWRCVFGVKDSGMKHPKKNVRGKLNQGRFVMASILLSCSYPPDLPSDIFLPSLIPPNSCSPFLLIFLHAPIFLLFFPDLLPVLMSLLVFLPVLPSFPIPSLFPFLPQLFRPFNSLFFPACSTSPSLCSLLLLLLILRNDFGSQWAGVRSLSPRHISNFFTQPPPPPSQCSQHQPSLHHPFVSFTSSPLSYLLTPSKVPPPQVIKTSPTHILSSTTTFLSSCSMHRCTMSSTLTSPSSCPLALALSLLFCKQ